MPRMAAAPASAGEASSASAPPHPKAVGPADFLVDRRSFLDWRRRAHPEVWLTSWALRYLLVTLDVVAIFVGYYLAMWVVEDALAKRLVVPWLHSPLVPAVLAGVVLFVMQYTRAYQDRRFLGDRGDWLEAIRATATAVVVGLALAVLAQMAEVQHVSRTFVALASLCVAGLLLAARAGHWQLRRSLRARGWDVRRCLVIGDGTAARSLRDFMGQHPDSGLRCVGVLSAWRQAPTLGVSGPNGSNGSKAMGHGGGRSSSGPHLAPLLADLARLTRAIRRLRVDEVILAAPDAPISRVVQLIVHLDQTHVSLRVAHPAFHQVGQRLPLRFESVHGLPVVDLDPFLGGPLHVAFKRGLDFAFSLAVVVLGAPVWLLIALLIYLQDRGAPLFAQWRVGAGGKPFRVLKYRTMRPGAEQQLEAVRHLNFRDGPMFKVKDDPRCTPIGRLLRRYSLDEIPQFLNVLAGQMSVVGARPPLLEEVPRYQPWQLARLRGWVGCTGLWQICGRDEVSFDEVVLFDLFYNRNANVFLDLLIMVRTVGVMLTGKGAH